jgi:para-nitrobenzyl esterase
VPVILGANADEGSLFLQLAGTKVADEAAFEMLTEALVPGHGKEIVAKYPSAMYGSAQKAAAAAVGDAAFVCPTRRAARAIAAASGDAYLYHFTYSPEGSLFGDLGAFHSAEIKFVFGTPGQLLPDPLTDNELKLSAAMMGYWSRLGEKGDPNGEGAFVWPKYDAAKDESLILDMTVSTQAGLKKDVCDFWDGVASAMP